MNAQFISNSANGEDLFHGKTQDRIAANIAMLIQSTTQQSPFIGLEGSWGAGKSNVIKIIASKLSSTHHVFIHDAWGHQEDLQRRAFLEELTEDLYQNNVLDKGKWKTKLNDLLSKKLETVTKTVPRLSTGLIITAGIALFTPLTTNLAEGFSEKWIKYLILLSPFLIAFFYWIISSLRSQNGLQFSELFYIYKDKELENRTETITSEEEPSSRIFKAWMSELSLDLKDGPRKLIIVFDNMDRLTPDKVQILWSSINTFFSDNSYQNITVIIPFDRAHIHLAFDNNPEIANQFINKSFPIVFRIAQPVMTDWQAFFDLKFKLAFGEGVNDQLLIIKAMYDIAQLQITPRDIIAFINEMVATALVIAEDVELKFIALFCIKRETILLNPVFEILNLEFLSAFKKMFLNLVETQDSIAAIVYNVPKASAGQVVLKREVENCIRSQDQETFLALSSNTHFVHILEQLSLVDDNLSPSFINLFGLVQSDLPLGNKAAVKGIWNRLNSYYNKTEMETGFEPASQVLLSFCDEEGQKYHIDSLVAAITKVDPMDGKIYRRSIEKIEETCKTNKIDIDLVALLQPILLDPVQFIAFLEAGNKFRKELKVSVDEAKLNEYLIGQVSEELPSSKFLAQVAADFDFSETLDHLKAMIGAADEGITEKNFDIVYSLMKVLDSEKPFPKLSDTIIRQLLETAKEDSLMYYDLVAMRLGRGNRYAFEGIDADSFLQKSYPKDMAFIQQISRRAEYYQYFGDLLQFAGEWMNPLLKAVARNLVANSYGTSRMNITSVLKKYDVIASEFALDHGKFLARLNGWLKFAKKDISEANIKSVITSPDFYDRAIMIKNDLTKHLISCYVQYLKKLSQVGWKNLLVESDVDFINLLRFIRSGHIKTIPTDGVLAYREFLVDISKHVYTVSQPLGFLQIFNISNKTRLKATIKDIRDNFINSVAIDEPQFLLFFPMFLELGDLDDRLSDVIRRILTPVAGFKSSALMLAKEKDIFLPLILKAGDEGAILIGEFEAFKDEYTIAEFIKAYKKAKKENTPKSKTKRK